MKANAPIGIFDSGIGGLTVAHAIKDELPNESLIYFGDTAHLPYGDKSAASIRHYSARITSFLMEQGAKMIVIACNTASAHAYQTVCDVTGPNVPVVNVIDPVSAYIAQHYTEGKVGVIGTKGTISTRIYPRKIESLNPNLRVASRATPLLASMIEEGFFNNKISQAVVHSYLEHPTLKGIQALVLGCTHYPLIRKEVEAYYKKGVEVIDSGQRVAAEVHELLKANKALSKGPATYTFHVSDYTSAFETSTKVFFGEKIKLKESRIWD
jgi:glutamate racemase